MSTCCILTSESKETLCQYLDIGIVFGYLAHMAEGYVKPTHLPAHPIT